MRTTITETIARLEREKNVRVLFACETGSRAWGFPSPDSDYDVRLIYRHETKWYLSLSEKKDTIEAMLNDGDLDITGWDLRKSLKLLWKSNGPLLERLQSPIVYYEAEGFRERMAPLAEQCFSPVATLYHYLNMGEKSFSEVEDQPQVKLKKLFYALRAAFACKWIFDKGTTPPIVFRTMLDELETDAGLRQRILELIALKAGKPEAYMHPAEHAVNAFIRDTFNRSQQESSSLKGRRQKDVDLDSAFLHLLENY